MTINATLLRTSMRQDETTDFNTIIYKIKSDSKIDIDNSEELFTFLKTIVAGGVIKVLFDLQGVHYIDSSGIGVLINIAKIIRSNKGDIALLNVSTDLESIFKLVKLQRFISIFPNEEDAVNFFKL